MVADQHHVVVLARDEVAAGRVLGRPAGVVSAVEEEQAEAGRPHTAQQLKHNPLRLGRL